MSVAMTLTWVTSSERGIWQKTSVELTKRAKATAVLSVEKTDSLGTLDGFGTCFNELGWDALSLVTPDERADIMRRLFSPEGDLRLTMGRIPMNANDYARSWYSCDEVSGDFELAYFNIDRDREALIPYIKMAQEVNPDLWFWLSPWSPPAWMKVNQDYPVVSNERYNTMPAAKDALLFGRQPGLGLTSPEGEADGSGAPGERQGVFPERLATNDYLIQDPRYLQAYADYFARFITAYAEEGIGIRRVMYQNEAWSYTPYPGCAWTPEGIIRFNVDYLGPTLRRVHPDVELFFGTINTNRREVIEQVMRDEGMRKTVKGMGFQWEGGQLIEGLKQEFPEMTYVQTESECGSGTFDWAAAEHTFSLLNHYLGLGCRDYTFWNAVLTDEGVSPWGWRQNALISIERGSGKVTYTPEYYAVMHYTNTLAAGSKLLGVRGAAEEGMPVIVFLSPEGQYEVVAANLGDEPRGLCVKLGKMYLNVALSPHTFNSFKG